MVINNLYFNPLASTPDRARLLNIARAWDPGITREQLDNWIDNMREDLLTRIYYETDTDLGSQNRPPAPGFASVDKTWRFARRVDPWIAKEEVAAFIRKQSIDQDLQRARRLGTFLTTGALEQIEIDLADFTTKAARGDRASMYGWEQGGPVPRYALVAIDNFSKKLAAIPVDSKDATTIVRALDEVVQRLGKPVRFVSDEGPEFDNNAVLTYCRDMGTSIVFLRSYANTVERVIGSLKSMLFPRVQRFGRPWTDFLPAVVAQYNQTVHSTTGMTPDAAHDEANNQRIFKRITKGRRFLKKIRQGRRPPLNAGDLVKIQVPHSTTRRLNMAQYGPRPYPVQAIVSDESGLRRYRVAGQVFLRHELLKIKDVQRNVRGGLESLLGRKAEDLDDEFGDLRGRMGRARAGPEPAMSEYVMGDAVPARRRRIRGKQLVLPTAPANFLELYNAMLESRRTGVGAADRERAFYIAVAQVAAESAVIYTRERKVALLTKALMMLGYGIDDETPVMRALLNELRAQDATPRRIVGKQRRQGVTPPRMEAEAVVEAGESPKASKAPKASTAAKAPKASKAPEAPPEAPPEASEAPEAPPPKAPPAERNGRIRDVWIELMRLRESRLTDRIGPQMNEFYRLVHRAGQLPEPFTFPATIRAKMAVLEAARDALHRPRFNVPRNMYDIPPPGFSSFAPLEGDYMVLLRELRGQSRAEFQMPPDTGGASSSSAPAAPLPPAKAPPAKAPQPPGPQGDADTTRRLNLRGRYQRGIERAREERRRDEEAAATAEIIEDSPAAEAAEVLPPPGALYAARTTTMAAAFYRLIAVVLGEPYRPPVNLQDRIDRLQRARDIMLPYRYDSFERVLDVSAINVELVQLGRMLDEL